METDTLASRPSQRLRADVPEPGAFDHRPLVAPALWVGSLVGFLLIGGASLDLGPVEAKLGLSAQQPLAPFGQVNGMWDPTVWAGSILPSRIWELAGRMRASAAAVRWPSVVAGALLGLVLTRFIKKPAGTRASVLAGLCWFGSVGLIDHSAATGLDLILGLGVVGCLARIVHKGSDWMAGLALGWAFLAGGWPPVALVALTTIVIGRKGAGLSPKLLVPTIAAMVGWSVWSLKAAPSVFWGAALAWPLTQSSTWDLLPGLLAVGLPWTPFALLGLSRSVRDAWSAETRGIAKGWMQATIAAIIVGTVIPGMAPAARVAALAGLAMLAGMGLDAMLAGSAGFSRSARNGFRVGLGLIVFGWLAANVAWGGYVGFAIPYYRAIAALSVGLAFAAAGLGLAALRRADGRVGLGALVVVAIGLKLAHWGYYVPEWNYRESQGPWGRAVGQWVPPKQTIYITHDWSPDFTFAIDRPVRRLIRSDLLKSRPGDGPHFVLLHEEEFKHWPDKDGKLVKVASFQDEFGSGRVLARTEGPYSWRNAR